jgi:hypothetical protein
MLTVGEFRKTRHPRNVKLNKVLEVCFSGAGNSRISEAWNLRSLGFANMLSSGILIRQRSGVTRVRKPGISTGDGPNFGELPIRESDEDPVRGSGVWTSMNQRGEKGPVRGSAEDLVREFDGKTFMNRGRSKVKVVVPKSPSLECELVAGL